MIKWIVGAVVGCGLAAGMANGQGRNAGTPAPAPGAPGQSNWRAADRAPATAGRAADLSPAGSTLDKHQVPSSTTALPVRNSGRDTLPRDQGQVWREYDISAYTSSVRGIDKPEQAIRDWILRETGTEVWFSEPLGLLSADRQTVTVYHTPEMQRITAEVIGRFVNGSHEPHVLGLRLITIGTPNWRGPALRLLQRINVQTPGMEAWLITKENAAVLLSELRKRADFQEHSAPNLVYYNGQTQSISQLRPRNFLRSYRARSDGWAGVEPEMSQLQEGFTLSISPLLSPDERTMDAVLKCTIDNVERLVPVSVDLPGFNNQIQRAQIQVPQLVSWRLHERFRWPTDQVLLLSCGVVAAPGPERPNPLGILSPIFGAAGRSDALLFVECHGKASQALLTGRTTTVGGQVTSGARY